MKTEEILNDREKTHGNYDNVAMMTQEFDAVFGVSQSMQLDKTSSPQKLAIRMIFLKLARIMCGDPTYADHWDDIAGYAMLGKGISSKMEHMQEEPTEKCYCDGVITCTPCLKRYVEEGKKNDSND